MTSFDGRGGVEVRCVDLGHIYEVDGEQVAALAEIQIWIAAGERVALFGPSGSGKSTLVALLAGLRRATSGEIRIGDTELSILSERQLLRLRGRQVGIVLQNPGRSLLPYGTAEDNVRFARRSLSGRARRQLGAPRVLLNQLGLGHLAGAQTAKLSGGEQQRLSVAVAMATAPSLLLADEPTSQLDGTNRDLVVDLMTRVTDEFGTTMAVVTHDPVVADAMHRRITMAEGRVVDSGKRAHGGWNPR